MTAANGAGLSFTSSADHQHSDFNRTSLLLEGTLTRARNLNAEVCSLASGLADAIATGHELHNGNRGGNQRQNFNTPIQTIGPLFIRKFQNQVRKELEALEELLSLWPSLLEDKKLSHRVNSTNLPHLEAIWKIFISGQYVGIISVGSAVKPGEHGDLIVDYGEHIIKVSRVTVQQIKRELGALKAEMADDKDNFRARDWIPYLDVYKVAQRIASDTANPLVEDTVLRYKGLKFLRSSRNGKRQVTIAFCSRSDSEEDRELLEIIKAEFKLLLKVNVQVFDLTRVDNISTADLVNKVLANDTCYFVGQIPSVLIFDVTGLLCIVSDITNLNPDQSQIRLESQQSVASGTYKKSENGLVFLKKQIEAERYQSVRDIIVSLLRGPDGRDPRILMCSSSVKDKLFDIVSKMGSSDEKRRTELLFGSDETLRIDREEMLVGIPKIKVFNTTSIRDGVAIDEEWIACNMPVVEKEYGPTAGMEFMMVTGNYKMAKQLRSRFAEKFSKGILVLESRSLLGS
ncbi:uncharacterized protein V1513DRAFT_440541 [Lipomyces chichibuensis]|uniref:uncharacterized protein n=1 Tax=Lipomyces chichibuensis TaxID=1546026 RepID=UPI0033430175